MGSQETGVMTAVRPERILIVTGMSGAGKTTALKTLEDLGWETVDNLPFALLDRLLATRPSEGAEAARPLALGVDSRTRGFDAQAIVLKIKRMRDDLGEPIDTLFLDCSGAELERRYSETRRRHPLAPDRPAVDGIARERELIAPLRRWADHVIDTSDSSSNDLKQELRARFETDRGSETVLTLMSFGFARGLPRNADLVFDVRYLRNPFWEDELRDLTGDDAAVQAYVSNDPAWPDSAVQIENLLKTLLPRYRAQGKAYVTIAFGCTGGRHRSVFFARWIADRLREAGFAPILAHRDLGAPVEGQIQAERSAREQAGA
jgi:RNase adapter protein RapZ